MQVSKVVLVNECDVEVGTMEKMEAHRSAHLHRAFSVFIFNQVGSMLLQRRAIGKYHSGGLWTNACCSHPLPGEDTKLSAKRRLAEEMGFETELTKIFEFTYKSEFENGLTEHEFDHVFTGIYQGKIKPSSEEVNDYCYMKLEEISTALKNHPQLYTSWFHIAFPLVEKWANQQEWLRVN